MFDTATKRRLGVHDFQEFRETYAPWMPDTKDPREQEYLVRLWEPTGARGLDDPIGCGTLLFGKLFFPKATRKLMSRQRIELLVALDNQDIAFINSLAHRTFGKTTWMMIFAARQIVMRFSRFMLYTSSEYKIASRRTEAIRSALVSEDFKVFFGDLRPRRVARGVNSTFSADTYFLSDFNTGENFACISPRGSGQAVNGSIAPLSGGDFARVDLVLNDDGQPRKNIHNSNVRETYEEWLEAELFQTVETDEQPGESGRWSLAPGQRAPWRIIMGDSCKHRLGVSVRWNTKPGWHSLVYPAARVGADGQLYAAHEIYTDEAVRAMARRMKPDHWAREFMCEPTSADAVIYKQTMFSHVDPLAHIASRKGNLFRFLVVDPSRVGHERANPTSILAVAVDLGKGGKITFLENLVANMEPEVYYARMFQIARDWSTSLIYIEDSGLANVLRNAVKTHAQLAGCWNQLEFKWLQSKRATDVEYGSGPEAVKVARAASLLPYYRQGLIQHAHSMRGAHLERHLLEWPECSEWGPTDTAGYVPEILEIEGIYLEGIEPESAPFDADETDDYMACGRFFRSLSRRAA